MRAENRLIWVHPGSNTQPNRGQPEPYTLFNYNQNGQVERRDRRFTKNGPRQDLSLLWDGDDRLREVRDFATGTLFFSGLYDGAGLRVQKQDTRGGALQTHQFSWGPGGLYHENNTTTGVATTYTPGYAQRQGMTDRFFHVDWLGSTRLLSDSSGTNFPSELRYDAYGNRSATPAGPDHPTDLLFAGAGWGYQSEYQTATEPGVGLQYLEQRYYDPAVGRFLSPDPISFLGGVNLYQYVGNDPVNGVDPSGLDEVDDLIAGRASQRRRLDRLNQDLARGLGTGLGALSAVNPGAGAAMVVNDAGAGNYGSAALRLLGGAGRVLGAAGRGAVSGLKKVCGFFKPTMRPGGIQLSAGRAVALGRVVTQRALTVGDLGVRGSISQLRGTFSVVDRQALVRIDYIEGQILNPTQIIQNLSNLARSHGAQTLRIEGTLANERLFGVLTRRYGLQSRGATDFIEIMLK